MKMINSKKRSKSTKPDAVDALMSLPIRNLESRMRFLENEIVARQHVQNNVEEALSSQRTSTEEALRRIKYADVGGPLSVERMKHGDALRELEDKRLLHLETEFRDMTTLRSRLQEAKEELRKVRERRRLIDELDLGGAQSE